MTFIGWVGQTAMIAGASISLGVYLQSGWAAAFVASVLGFVWLLVEDMK